MTDHLHPRPALRRRSWFRFRALVRSERAWRLAGSVILCATAVYSTGVSVAATDAAQDARREAAGARAAAARVVSIQEALTAAACDTRIESRASVRKAIVGVIDPVISAIATYGGLPEADRTEVVGLAVDAANHSVLRDLPAPDC